MMIIPYSIYLNGQWLDATWLNEVADHGDLVLTATVDGEQSSPNVIALRIPGDMLRRLLGRDDSAEKPHHHLADLIWHKLLADEGAS